MGRGADANGGSKPPYLFDIAVKSFHKRRIKPLPSSMCASMNEFRIFSESDFMGFPGGSFFPQRFRPLTTGSGAGCRKISEKRLRAVRRGECGTIRIGFRDAMADDIVAGRARGGSFYPFYFHS